MGGHGRYEDQALLVQTGVGSYTGVQNYPSMTMWNQIDPKGTYEEMWNRLAHVQWTPGKGEPTVTNPSPDVVIVTFDPCSEFAQQHVDYVLASFRMADAKCVTQIEQVKQGTLMMYIYDVVPSS